MVDFKRIQMSLFLTAVLQFTAAAAEEHLYLTVRVGDEVTLPSGNVIDGQQQCDSTTWLFAGSGSQGAVELIQLGQIGKNARAKSNRLSVTEKCFLVIKNVTVEDAGDYTCRQYNKLGQQQGPGSVVPLSVVTMTEDEDDDKVTLTCSVSTYGRCGDTVKWLFNGRDVDKDNRDLKTSQSPCRASVAFLTYNYIYTSRYDFFTCEVTDGNRVKKFPFRLQPSGEKPGEDTTTTTTEPTTTAKSTTTEISMKAGKTTTASTINEASTEPQSGDTRRSTTENSPTTNDTSTEVQEFPIWAKFLIVAVGVAALLLTVVALIRWKRAKGRKPQTPETSRDAADPEDGVSYASVSYTRKTDRKARALVNSGDDDEGDAVTYTTLKASSSSAAAASADPSNLYATVNTPSAV